MNGGNLLPQPSQQNRRPRRGEAVGSGLLTLTGYVLTLSQKETTPRVSGVVYPGLLTPGR